jgi:hypothetical protein
MVECSDCGEEDWINKVNRGGLFKLSNNTFNLFVCIEKQVQHLLPIYMAKAESDSHTFKETIVKQITQCEDVEWNWTLLSQCIDTESNAIELLEAIVTLWVTIRGHSITATWMEVYKVAMKKTTKKNPALRKTLKKS